MGTASVLIYPKHFLGSFIKRELYWFLDRALLFRFQGREQDLSRLVGRRVHIVETEPRYAA